MLDVKSQIEKQLQDELALFKPIPGDLKGTLAYYKIHIEDILQEYYDKYLLLEWLDFGPVILKGHIISFVIDIRPNESDELSGWETIRLELCYRRKFIYPRFDFLLEDE